ncbi:MAG: DUF2461 domain-containing protein [Frankiaceae bacterium]|nr:DUF2461 domain-containing protein [Frankiaceae bacterium]MBV9870666.1 DUF2461 domain-containing protein [Frankiaceae bacterium]
MAFKGWPAEALEFYEGLTADNSKTYWQANKSTYDDVVLAPMKELLTELEPEFGPAKIFRPYRDVRFSKDKTPYKTQIAASFERSGYIALSADGLGVGSGMYHLESEQLARYRDAVAADKTGEPLQKIVADLIGQGIEVSAHDTLKIVPRGYNKDHPRNDLLRHKGLIGWRQFPVKPWLGTAKAKTKIVEFFHVMAPLNDWLAKNVL